MRSTRHARVFCVETGSLSAYLKALHWRLCVGVSAARRQWLGGSASAAERCSRFLRCSRKNWNFLRPSRLSAIGNEFRNFWINGHATSTDDEVEHAFASEFLVSMSRNLDLVHDEIRSFCSLSRTLRPYLCSSRWPFSSRAADC